ncbi:hypothetical protein I4U23_002226 [Adineta vaga]|nr:hypothetical protein I4U23_002226 [Adineta vaga]
MSEQEIMKTNDNELEPEQKRKVFIGSLSYNIDENTFRDYWTKFGNVLDATILRDREGRSRGFGFVTFDNSASVDALMDSRPHTLDNRVVEPKRAIPREETHRIDVQTVVKKLYLGGVKEPMTEDDLRDYFSKYGAVTDIVITKDRDGKYRGFGFVEFDDYDPVDKVILERNHVVAGQQLVVQKSQAKTGSQRSSGNMRSRPGPSSMSRSTYNGGYNNYQQQNSFNNSYDQMPNNDYNGYSSNFNGGNNNGDAFGQGYDQRNFGGPMRRGNMGGGGHGYAPYNGRGRGGGRGGRGGGGMGGGDVSQGPSWASWN